MGGGNSERLKVVFSTSVTIHYILAIIVAILCEIIGVWYVNEKMVIPPDRLVAANWCLQISILNFCTNLITIPYNAALIAHEEMRIFAFVSVFEGIARLGICFIIMWTPFDRLIFYAILYFLIQVIVRTIYQVYCKRNFEECKYEFVLDRPLLKRMFGYSGWHIIGNSATILSRQGVDLILNFFCGPVLNATRGISNQVLSAVSGFAGNFTLALNPQITKTYASNEIDYSLDLVFRGARFSYYVLFLISLPIILNANYILHIWLTEVPPYAAIFVQLSLILSLVTALSTTLIVIQNATGNVRNYQMIVGGTLLLNMPLSYFMLYHGISPASVMIIAIFIEVACLLERLLIIPKYIEQFKPSKYISKVISKCFLVSIVAFIAPLICCFYIEGELLKFIIISGVSLLSSSLSILYLGCTTSERRTIICALAKITSKIFHRL